MATGAPGADDEMAVRDEGVPEGVGQPSNEVRGGDTGTIRAKRVTQTPVGGGAIRPGTAAAKLEAGRDGASIAGSVVRNFRRKRRLSSVMRPEACTFIAYLSCSSASKTTPVLSCCLKT